MDRELQILVGVMKRIEAPSGIITSLMVPRRVVAIEETSNLMRMRRITEERVMEKEIEWKGSQGLEILMIGGNKRDQDVLMIRNIQDTMLKMIMQGRTRDPEHMIVRNRRKDLEGIITTGKEKVQVGNRTYHRGKIVIIQAGMVAVAKGIDNEMCCSLQESWLYKTALSFYPHSMFGVTPETC